MYGAPLTNLVAEQLRSTVQQNLHCAIYIMMLAHLFLTKFSASFSLQQEGKVLQEAKLLSECQYTLPL